MQLALQLLPLPGQLGALSRVGEALGMMQPLRVGLASLIFSGRVRVALKPLMNKLPIVAAMQARSTRLFVRSPATTDKRNKVPGAFWRATVILRVGCCAALPVAQSTRLTLACARACCVRRWRDGVST